ncbi:asparagine synthase (glutamine-hydrolyzing) [Clostridium minihomine]|uniref:asparagine synthase (glutamine-hydrolyzing) n=1 Tax=Clostridium minihomine TaxID=2045012 RepID=UPI000C784410|nr:asparagine synthase (glutamine-hydrolyzing) [Clostridium minihomine]
MCGIAGFCDYHDNLTEEAPLWGALAKRMGNRLKHRGPDEAGVHVSRHAAFAHARLAVVDIEGGKQPMTRMQDGFRYTITYNGELYNTEELRQELNLLGCRFTTRSDTEVLLNCYIQFGPFCAEKLNGIFAFAIDDERRGCTFLCRDRFGIKPLFYSTVNGRLVFGSEIKSLFEYPGLNPILDQTSLCELFGLGPARTAGCGVFQNIQEIKPGYSAVFNREGLRAYPYFELESYEHPDSYEDTVLHVRQLLEDTVHRQLISDVPLCTFLSGGLDSSIITALAAVEYKKQGKVLDTYSFDYKGNDKYFKPNAFQPDADRPWAERMISEFGTNHRFLECDTETLVDRLYDAVIAKDLPGMADVDSSLLHFCSLVKANHVVALSGECADEIFGGYPWFHTPEAFEGKTFPWSPDLKLRTSLLKPEILHALSLEDYVNQRYTESVEATPRLPGESAEERRRREISFLNINWFMSTLLDRKDRNSMAAGLEVRVPYADHRLVQYVFNTPWEFKNRNGVAKGLLRDAAKEWLPEDVLMRKKSPYPKTHNPAYEALVRHRLSRILADPLEPIHMLISGTAAKELLSEKSDYGKPWFGQLMAGPQLMAYLLQINFWLKRYDISIQL